MEHDIKLTEVYYKLDEEIQETWRHEREVILDYYESSYSCNKYVDVEIPNILSYISSHIFSSVNDPKGIQGDLNTLSYEDKIKISDRASSDYLKALDARTFENNSDYESSINKWGEIFGGEFPSYGQE